MTRSAHRILVPSHMLDHLKARVSERFDVVYADRIDGISDEEAASLDGFAGWGRIDRTLIDRMANLKIIASYGVGYDTIDAAYAAEKGVVVTHTPDVLSEEVADVTVGLLLNTLRELPRAEAYLREGRWVKEAPFDLSPLTLRGRHVGIYGLGRIGLEIAKRLEGFGVEISYHARSQKTGVRYGYAPTLKVLAEAVDTLVIAVPGGPETEKSVDAEILRALGAKGVVINIGRGSVIDEDALIEALQNRTIAAAGLDVFAHEPNVPDALLALPNVSVLPHIASGSVATRNAMADLVADNLIAWFDEGRALTPVPECADVAASASAKND